nr:hypothetical protein [Rappaport israeli]
MMVIGGGVDDEVGVAMGEHLFNAGVAFGVGMGAEVEVGLAADDGC